MIEAFAPNNEPTANNDRLSHTDNLMNLVYDYPPDTNHILEVKYDNILPKFIAQTLESNRTEQTNNSKFCICRDATALFTH